MSANPSVTEMCLRAVKAAAQQKAEQQAESAWKDELIVLALSVLVESIDKELDEATP